MTVFQKECPIFRFPCMSFSCFLLDLRSCSPKCEIRFISSNSEYLCKSPTSLSPSVKKLWHICSKERLWDYFLISFMCALTHVCMHLCVILWHVVTCMHSCKLHRAQDIQLWAYVLTGLSIFYPLWSGHHPISWDVATQNVVYGTPRSVLETENQRVNPRHTESESAFNRFVCMLTSESTALRNCYIS